MFRRLIVVISLVIGIWSLGFSKVSAQGWCSCQLVIEIPWCSSYQNLCEYGYTPTCNLVCGCSCSPLPTTIPPPPPPSTPYPSSTSVPKFIAPIPTDPPNTTPYIFPTLPPNSGQNCENAGKKCVTNNLICNCGTSLCTSTQSDCPVGYKCVAETASCKPPSTIPTCASMGGECVPNNYICNTVTLPYFCLAAYKCVSDAVKCKPPPTPIPTRPVPKVFCKPPNGGPSNDPKDGGVWTNLGCVPYNSKSFASGAMTWGVGLGGGVAFLVIVYAAFLYVSSGGDPKKVQAAKELIVALIGGIALIIFAVLFLNYLGVNILNLGGLGFKG